MAGKDPKSPAPPATRKAKPRDLAEAHKPSRKVALNEVLRSLQDLVNNELATTPSGEPAAEKASPEPVHSAAPAQSPPSGKPGPDRAAAATAARKSAASSIPVPPEGLQQELELEAIHPASTEEPLAEAGPDAAAATPETLEALPPAEAPAVEISPDAPAIPVEPPAVSGDEMAPPESSALSSEPVPAAPEPSDAAAEATIDIDDLGEIPVLEDIIDLGEEHAGGALPEAGEARRIAIQVAARLNVELRKAGKPGLTSDVITRLVRILGEALAKAGTNMENNPPEKH